MMEEKEFLKLITKKCCSAIGGKYSDNTCVGKEGEYSFTDKQGVNFKPHPYMITPRHVAFASEEHFGILSKEAIEEAERLGKAKCGWKGCALPYWEHSHETAVFLKVKSEKELKDIEELRKCLLGIKEDLKKEKVDGVAFVKG